MLVKFEQNGTVRTTKNLPTFDAILEDIPVTETIV